MRARSALAAMVIAITTLGLPADAGAQDPSPSAGAVESPSGSPGAIDLEAATVGPNGEASTPVDSIPALTDEQKAAIASGGHKAALLWAGSGTWYNALTAGASDEFAALGVDVVTE